MVLAAPGVDAISLKALGDTALGINLSFHWNSDFDNPANKKFIGGVAEEVRRLDRIPTYYTSQARHRARDWSGA